MYILYIWVWEQGDAILVWNVKKNGQNEPLSAHSALPATEVCCSTLFASTAAVCCSTLCLKPLSAYSASPATQLSYTTAAVCCCTAPPPLPACM